MWEVRQRENWNHTADIIAAVFNAQGPETPFERADFHPMLEKTMERTNDVNAVL